MSLFYDHFKGKFDFLYVFTGQGRTFHVHLRTKYPDALNVYNEAIYEVTDGEERFLYETAVFHCSDVDVPNFLQDTFFDDLKEDVMEILRKQNLL